MTEYKGHSHGEYDDDCPICYLDAEIKRLNNVIGGLNQDWEDLDAYNADLEDRIKELKSGSCRYNCRKAKEAYMAALDRAVPMGLKKEVKERYYKEFCK